MLIKMRMTLLMAIVLDSTDFGTPAMFGWNKLDFDAAGWPFVTTLNSNS